VMCPQEASSTSRCGSSPPAKPRVVSGQPRIPDRPYDYLPELSSRRTRDSRSLHLGRLCRCTTSRWRDR
jgi:hypothetical protein